MVESQSGVDIVDIIQEVEEFEIIILADSLWVFPEPLQTRKEV